MISLQNWVGIPENPCMQNMARLRSYCHNIPIYLKLHTPLKWHPRTWWSIQPPPPASHPSPQKPSWPRTLLLHVAAVCIRSFPRDCIHPRGGTVWAVWSCQSLSHQRWSQHCCHESQIGATCVFGQVGGGGGITSCCYLWLSVRSSNYLHLMLHHIITQTYDTCMQTSPEIWKETKAG